RTPPVADPTEAPATPPTWAHLPAPTQQEVIRLLTQMLLARAARTPLARPVRGGDHERRQSGATPPPPAQGDPLRPPVLRVPGDPQPRGPIPTAEEDL